MPVFQMTVVALYLIIFVGTDPAWADERSGGSSAAEVSREAKEAIEATKEYTAEQKDAFQKAVKRELEDLQANLKVLQQKTNEASAEARLQLQKAVTKLEQKKEVARKKLEELNAASTLAWSALKEGMNAALQDLKTSYDDTISRLP